MINTSQVNYRLADPRLGSLAAVVGNTPLLHLERVTRQLSPKAQVFAKAEWFNPGGSIKDRPALAIISNALTEGKLTGGKRLLDSTSGNMGISYATFGAAMGIPVTLVIPSNASPERMTILRALGAELIISDPLEGSDGALKVARQMAEEQPDRYFYANQYNNPANWMAHSLTTGPEIVEQTGGKITHLVAGLGTSGTLTGAGRYLRGYNPAIQLVAVQPDSPFHGLEGLKHMASAIQPGIYDPGLPDRTIQIGTEEAYAMARRLAREEGLFVGVSSAAAALAAFKLAEEQEECRIVAIFPDSGYKYLSDPFWDEKR